MIKAPSAIAPAARTANRFLFIVGLVCCLEALFRAFKRDDRAHGAAVTKFFAVVVTVLAAASADPAHAWHKHLYTRSCNQSAVPPVMLIGVDALSITWMILTQALWLKLRFKTTTKQRASWSDGFIHWWPGSSARIGRVEHRRRTFAR
jgi:hypothetical protein